MRRPPWHPEVVAKERAHGLYCGTSAQWVRDTLVHDDEEECSARPDPLELAALWEGKARMAQARLRCGAELNDLDHEALTVVAS